MSNDHPQAFTINGSNRSCNILLSEIVSVEVVDSGDLHIGLRNSQTFTFRFHDAPTKVKYYQGLLEALDWQFPA